MSVQFIIGASGTGKSTHMFDEIIKKSKEEKHNPLFLILPEQANLSAEREMVKRHPNGGTMDISILSFTRLAYKVFDELGEQTGDILNDYGKSMVIMKLLKRCQGELTYYGGMVGKNGFVDELKSLFSEFYQYQVTPAILEGLIEELPEDKSIHHKLSDLCILLKAFEDELKNSYMVSEQLLALLAEVLENSAMLKDADIYFDGFTGFTPVQYKVIEALMKNGCNLFFSFTMDAELFGKNDYKENDLFFMGRQAVDRLCRLAGDNNVDVLPHVGMTEFYRLEGNAELSYAERHIFRFPVKAYEGEPEYISLVKSDDIKGEITFIAKMIKHFVRDKGYQYKDFAVITGDLAEQLDVWNQVLDGTGIPYFLDASEPLSKNPVAIITGMIMDLYRNDFSYESVFAFLKTGYFSIKKRDICKLENYVLKHGIRGYSSWEKAFRGNTKGLAVINKIRADFMKLLEPLHSTFKQKTAKGSEYVKALYDFMVANEIPRIIHGYSYHFEKAGDLRRAKAYDEVYAEFIEVIDKTMKILGEEELPREHFADVLMTGIGDVDLGIIPVTLDQVLIGDLERTRLADVKIIFFAGANEGILPRNTDSKGLLADKDRNELKEHNLLLAGDSKEEIFKQQYYMYMQLTKASERAYICYRDKDEKRSPIHPSYLVKRIKSLLPKLEVKNALEILGENGISDLPVSDNELISMFADKLKSDDIKDSSIYHLLKENDEDGFSRVLDGAYYSNDVGNLDEGIVSMLYGNNMVHSVSRLETFSGCQYRFFLQYGLGLYKRGVYTVESSDVGTILHSVMEQFFRGIKEGSIDKDIEEDELVKKVEEITNNVVTKIDEEKDRTPIFQSSNRSKHQLDVITRVAEQSARNLMRHLKAGSMELAYFEQEFSPEDKLEYTDMKLNDMFSMNLKGIIDRADIKVADDAVYVSVIDYKSSDKKVEFDKILEGKQLQLSVYMSVMMDLLKDQYEGKKIIPTGMFYYHLQDPIIEVDSDGKLEEMRIKENRLKGLANTDADCLTHMDKRTGNVVPVRYTKSNELHANNSSTVTTEGLECLSKFVKKIMTQIGQEIVQGQININPEKGKFNGPCDYCDYRNICRFEPGLGGDHYRVRNKKTPSEARGLVMKKDDENNNQAEDNKGNGGDE